MKIKRVLLVIGVFFTFNLGAAQFFNYDIYSCGSRGMGAGGAYVSVADDSSAVFWNPAGLVQQKQPVLTYLLDTQFVLNNIRDITSLVFKVTYSPLVLLSFIWPMKDLHKITFGIAEFTPIQRKSDDNFSIYEIGLPFAFMPIPRLAVGITPALMLGWRSTMISIPVGVGFQAGLLYAFSENFRWGFVFKSPFVMNWTLDNVVERFPMDMQTGLSVKLSDTLSLAADMEYQDWPGVEYTYLGNNLAPVFQTGFLYTWVPHFGILYNDDRTGAHLRLGYTGRPFMDSAVLKPQHVLTFGVTMIAEKINLVVDLVLVDTYLLSFFYEAPSYQETVQITVEYRFSS